ncbi:uncharacterized protein LOC142632439 [Castanea sativa]|uniref:uncharacterized protein LOC142632439 n=1 Tax=Castanea sativa TaxID=21020 RepID=UPI003F649C0A
MQKEIDHLKKKLRHERRRRTPSFIDPSSKGSRDTSYRPRSRTPLDESFSYEEDNLHGRKGKNSFTKGLGNDAMGRALHQISKSPFTRRVEEGKLPWRFTQPAFTIYNGRTDPMEHVSHFNQRMAVHSTNETLVCKVFPSSLGPMVMRWFDGLKAGSINSFGELTREFGSCFITCSRVPRPLDSLLSMAMREGETLKTFSDRYWEMFNEIDGDFNDVAIRTFKVGLLAEHDLRKSLTKKLERGYTTKDCRTLWNHLEQLVKEGMLKVMFVARMLAEDSSHEPKRIKGSILPFLGFLEEDKIGIIQPHDDALVVTLRIGGYDVRRIEELLGSQSMARQCMVTAILHQPGPESSALVEGRP